MNKQIIVIASLFGALAVVLGAFGAHGLKDLINPYGLEIWNKGVSYQFYHTFALLYLSTFVRYKSKLVSLAALFFCLGIILFSGSLYLLALKDAYNLSIAAFVGPITPLGGLCFILGWAFLFLSAIKHK